MSKTVVVTGCTKGIGLAVAKAFASAGYQVAGCARNMAELAALKQELHQINSMGIHTLLPCDVSDTPQLKQFIAQVNQVYQSVQVLVNNAGVFLPGSLITEADGVLENLLQTNVTSAYHVTRGVLPGMLQNKSGHVFNICSIASLQAYDAGASYTISKFALLGFSKQLRHETKGTGVKVTALMLGATLTNSWAGADLPEERFIKSEDVAQTILGVCELSNHADVEEIVIRPQLGDI